MRNLKTIAASVLIASGLGMTMALPVFAGPNDATVAIGGGLGLPPTRPVQAPGTGANADLVEGLIVMVRGIALTGAVMRQHRETR